MPEMQAAREALSHLLVGLQDVEESVVRGEKRLGEKAYAVAYIDFADEVVERSQHLRDFQERILGDDFFDAPGDLRWNKYLYIVAGPKSTANPQFASAKAAIEADKDYARKRVVSEADLKSLLGGAKLFEAAEGGETYDVLADWRRRLSASQLDLLLDCITPRTGVVEKIAKRGAGVPASGQQRVKELHALDVPLASSKLLSLAITRFRPVHDGKNYEFGNVTLIVGANGTGKTSLLEAIEHFYCGNNLRSKADGTVRIKGKLLGPAASAPVEISSISDGPRIKARCLAWYNRTDHSVDTIVDSFSQYNFLDTDAAYRLSAKLKPADVATELSRLLVGASAATTFAYLEKIRGDVDKAWDKAQQRVALLQGELTAYEKRLKELQSQPSTAKTLTDSYRAARSAIGWKRANETGVPQPEEGDELLAALGYVQALVSLGDAAREINDVEHRSNSLDAAVLSARPYDDQLSTLTAQEKALAMQIEEHRTNIEFLDRWLAYESAGFHDVRRRYLVARETSVRLASRLGNVVAGDLPEISAQYATLPVDVAVQVSRNASTEANERLSRAKQALDLHGKAASARASTAANLKVLALKALQDSSYPDTCPVCRTVHSAGALANLIEEITAGADTTAEVNGLAETLRLAEAESSATKRIAAAVEFCQKTAALLELKGTTPKEVLDEIAGLRQQANQAQVELQRVTKEGQDLRNAGFSSNESDSIWSRVGQLFDPGTTTPTVEIASETRRLQASAVEEKREELGVCRRQIEMVVQSIQSICRTVDLDGWRTRIQKIDSLASLMSLRDEFTAASKNIVGLRLYLEVGGDVPLAEVQARIAAVATAFKGADEASRDDSTNSLEQRELPSKIETSRRSLEQVQSEEQALDVAGKVLDDLFANASLESATREALDAIGGQINEVFSRIHAPREYEYVGSQEVLLQTFETHEARTLDQVSTGQRAAFALSIFLARNRTAIAAPPVLLIDDPIAHIDDLNALSFLDYLRDLAVNSGRQIFFSTADTRVASLFTKKFSFLGDSFKTIPLARTSWPEVETNGSV